MLKTIQTFIVNEINKNILVTNNEFFSKKQRNKTKKRESERKTETFPNKLQIKEGLNGVYHRPKSFFKKNP